MAFSNLQAMFKLAQRPTHTISGKQGEEFELKTEAKDALLIVKDCTDCHASLQQKAAKLLVEKCDNLLLDVKSTLLSGVLEFLSCKKVVLNFLDGGQIPTIMADSTTDLTINVLQHSQFESLYLHQSSNIEVCIVGETPTKHPVSFPSDVPLHFQFVVGWEREGEGWKLICEKVVREGVFPTTERKMKEAQERTARDLEKMATALVDSIRITPKGQQKDKPSPGKTEPSSGPYPTKPPSEKPRERPPPSGRGHHNIEDEEDKKEFFDSPEELEQKIDLLAKWVKESKHCVMFTGAGISTSTGIPDFRSGMNTVLKTGPGLWELQAKGAARKPGAAIPNMLRAIPSPAHMAIVKLHKEGLVKFTVSQNVDGLHLRSGIPSGELAELHGNTNLEKCTTCGAKYLRDFDTRTARRVHDHLTGRSCDNVKCRGPLVDSIINFGESLPEDELVQSYQEAKMSDLMIVLGSSLQVYPAADIPATVIQCKQKLVICNLQKTPLSSRSSLQIHSQIDAVMRGLMERLGLEIPTFRVQRRFAVETSQDKILIQGLDLECDTPYSFFKQVSVRVSQEVKGTKKVLDEKILSKEPLEMHFKKSLSISEANPLIAEIELGFQGHYGEPSMSFTDSITDFGKALFCAEYDLNTGQWSLKKY